MAPPTESPVPPTIAPTEPTAAPVNTPTVKAGDTVTVPATVKVTVNGKKVSYKVTSISQKAFNNNKKLKKVTVSKNIKTIGKAAFQNCSNLKTIVIKSSNITKVGKNALKGTAKNLVIKVPAKKVSAYKKLFKNKGNSRAVVKKA